MPQNIFKIYGERERNSFWQWDTGQKLVVLDRTIDQVHFSNKNMTTALVEEVYVDENGVRLCEVPDLILKMPQPLVAYAYAMDDDQSKTICAVKFQVSGRPIPEDYTYEEHNRFKDLVDKIESVEDKLENGAGVKKFNTLADAERWAQEYQIVGTLLSVYDNFEWVIYIVNDDYSLRQIGDTDQLIIDVDTLQRLVGETSVDEQIRLAILALDLSNTYEKIGAADVVRGELIEETKRAQNEESAITREIHKIYNNISDLQDTVQKNQADVSAALDTYKQSNDAAVQAIINDHLKEVDKTELEEKIKSNSDAISLLTNGVSADKIDGVNDLIKYVDEHGAEVIGIKKNIQSNTDAIAEDKLRADNIDARLKVIEEVIDDGGLTPDGNFVSYNEQYLTEEQKAQARENIGAIDKSALDNIGALVVSTDEEIIDILIQEDMFMAVKDSDGSYLSDENGNILLW